MRLRPFLAKESILLGFVVRCLLQRPSLQRKTMAPSFVVRCLLQRPSLQRKTMAPRDDGPAYHAFGVQDIKV